MQSVLEHFAVSVSAITGVLAARGKQVDLFGVLVLALVTAFGGGTVRDVLLGNLPVFWMADQGYILNAAATAGIVFFLVRYHELPASVLMVADAFALALFTMVGTRKGLSFPVAPSIAVLLGVTTGVAGGILRDLLIGEIPLVFRREIYLYATAAFGGAVVFVLLQHYFPGAPRNSILGILVTLLLRLAGIRWRIRLPMFRPKLPVPDNSKPHGSDA
ncbi:MAG: trimeric intracellular cation channel family protein [Verrucomicrobiota bacterium]